MSDLASLGVRPKCREGTQHLLIPGKPPTRQPRRAGGAPPCLGSLCSLLMESGVREEKTLLQTRFQVGLPLNNVALCLGPSPAPRVTHT